MSSFDDLNAASLATQAPLESNPDLEIATSAGASIDLSSPDKAKEFGEVVYATPHVEELLPVAAAPTKTHNFYDYSLPELEELLKGMGKEKFRAKQVFKWVYEKRVENYDEMSNVSKNFRAELPGIFHFQLPKTVAELKSKDGTRKWLFDIGDGMTIETVLIPNKDRLTLCVSSEVGCNIACRFCFTGKQKLKRRLSAGQIVGQFLHAQDSLAKDGLRVTNIVFMGMGEPLDNPDEVFKSIEILHDPNGINLSRRKITVSTSGLVPQMHKIAKAKVRLAVSLNAPNNEIRSFVMPINKKWNVFQLLDECRAYYQATGDRITFEYVLLKGVTDKIEQAKELWEMVRDIPCKINLIPFNEHPGSGFERPEPEQVRAFQNEMIRLGAHVLLRKTMGRDIFAACGQLTSKYEGRPDTLDVNIGQ
ncbi:MAG: 23S rRNA (adenine(2503)-C(2))-methyltransferase RlmN [Proteobacteria bacterium]|nr:MAG: 23S rRNA (adenine(2503)-C(2))-methyltransferase RlmN [Pseudomonadota bacterium]